LLNGNADFAKIGGSMTVVPQPMEHEMVNHQAIEVRGFKWPRRSTTVAAACLLGEDAFGRWLGIAKGAPWWAADHSRSGVFEVSFVKLVPSDTFWTACFHPVDPVVDVDIVLPVRWVDGAIEEVDLELDILRSADGSVQVRDREAFALVQEAWTMPGDIVEQAEETCEMIRAMVEQGAEPFEAVGRAWLRGFLTEVGTASNRQSTPGHQHLAWCDQFEAD